MPNCPPHGHGSPQVPRRARVPAASVPPGRHGAASRCGGGGQCRGGRGHPRLRRSRRVVRSPRAVIIGHARGPRRPARVRRRVGRPVRQGGVPAAGPPAGAAGTDPARDRRQRGGPGDRVRYPRLSLGRPPRRPHAVRRAAPAARRELPDRHAPGTPHPDGAGARADGPRRPVHALPRGPHLRAGRPAHLLLPHEGTPAAVRGGPGRRATAGLLRLRLPGTARRQPRVRGPRGSPCVRWFPASR